MLVPSRVNVRADGAPKTQPRLVGHYRQNRGIPSPTDRRHLSSQGHVRLDHAELCVDAACVNVHLMNEDGELLEPEMLCPAQHLMPEFVSGLIYVILGVINVVILKEVQNEDAREKVGEGVPKNYALVR